MRIPTSVSAPGEIKQMRPIEIDVLATKQAAVEAASLTRRRHYWLRTVLGAGYRLYLLIPGVYLGWLGLRGLVLYTSKATRDWLYALMSAALAMIPVFLAALIVRDVRRQLYSGQATDGRVKLTFTDDGVSGDDNGGFTFSDPWTRYEGFHVGQHVIVCPRIGSPVYLRIPTEGLPVRRQEEIRSLLSRHLPELSGEALRSRTES